MQAFHGAYVGVDLTDDADDLFQQGEPWTLAHGEQPDPDDGHCIVKVTADGHALDGYVTWGALQHATLGWSQVCLGEAWVIITQEDADAASLDIGRLRADINALDGTGGSGSPAPTPIHNHANFLIEMAGDVEAVLAKARAYLTGHGLL